MRIRHPSSARLTPFHGSTCSMSSSFCFSFCFFLATVPLLLCCVVHVKEEEVMILPEVETSVLTDVRVIDVMLSGRPKATTVLPHMRPPSDQLQILLRLTKV